MGFIFLLVAGFGWGKPVEINPNNFNGKYSISKAEALVASAGPIMNFLLAIIFMVIYYAIYRTTSIYLIKDVWQIALYYCITINIALGIFNLIPIPPLDGSKILTHFLPNNARNWFYNNQYYFYIVFLIIWITGLTAVIISPIFSAVYSGLAWAVQSLFNLF